jgi:hypothetical protein
MIILEKDISSLGPDESKFQCKLNDHSFLLLISRTAMSMLDMKIEDNIGTKSDILNNLLWRELRGLAADNTLKEINIDSEKIVFMTNSDGNMIFPFKK